MSTHSYLRQDMAVGTLMWDWVFLFFFVTGVFLFVTCSPGC